MPSVCPPAAGLLSAHGSSPWGSQMHADARGCDADPASGGRWRTEAQPCDPKRSFFLGTASGGSPGCEESSRSRSDLRLICVASALICVLNDGEPCAERSFAAGAPAEDTQSSRDEATSHARHESRSRQGCALRDDTMGCALRDDTMGCAVRDDTKKPGQYPRSRRRIRSPTVSSRPSDFRASLA